MRDPRIIIRTQGLKIGLESLSAIAGYLDYEHERNFLNRVRNRSFNELELKKMFSRLHFSDEDVLEYFGRGHSK